MEQFEEIRKAGSGIDPRLRLSFEVVLAIYFSFLLAFIYESRPPYAWDAPGRYLYFWHPHAVSLSRTDFALFYSELFLIPAFVIFTCIRLMKRTSLVRFLLPTVGGTLAVAGFPLVCLYSADRPSSFVVLELAIATACFLLWTYRKWPASAALNVLLLIVHYALWFFFCVLMIGMPRLDRPVASWTMWDYMVFVYPVLGFSYCIIWAAYFRHLNVAPGSATTPSRT